MKVEFIITVESDENVPENDACDQIADRLVETLVELTFGVAQDMGWDSRWRKTL